MASGFHLLANKGLALPFQANARQLRISLPDEHFMAFSIVNYYENTTLVLPSLMVRLSIFRCNPTHFETYSFSSSSLFKKFFTNCTNDNHCSDWINQIIVLALCR